MTQCYQSPLGGIAWIPQSYHCMTIPSGPDLRLCCILYDISQIGEIISHIVVPNLSGPAKGYTGQAK